MQPIFRALFVAALLALPSAAGSSSVFVGAPDGVGSVTIVDGDGVYAPYVAPGLDGIRLASLDFSSHAALEVLSDRVPRLRSDVPGAARLSLPGGSGSLYHFVRAAGAPDEHWGFFVVGADRVARVVVELASPAPGVDPFNPRVAIAADGSAMLVATVRAAGGDLVEVDLAHGASRVRTADLEPLDFLGRGLALADGFGVAVHRQGILRFDRASAGDAMLVGFAPGEYPTWFERAVVSSANGRWIATVAGDGPGLAYPFVFGAQGDARRMSNLAGDLPGAGLAPEAPNGPWLAVSDDGCACAWRAHAWPSWMGDELFLGTRASPDAPAAAEHVTRDELFEPYLDEVGVFVFTPTGRLAFVAGDPPTGANSFQRADVFRLDRGSAAPIELRNMTASSGEPLPPFDFYGSLEFTRIAWIAAANAYVALERESDELRVLAVPSEGVVRTLAPHVARIDLLETTDAHVLLSVLAQAGPTYRGLLRIPLDLASDPVNVLSLAAGVHVARGAVGADGSCALVTTDGNEDSIWSCTPATGAVALLSQHGVAVGPIVDVATNGAVMTTLESAQGGAALTSWLPGAPAVRVVGLPSGAFVLAGR